MGDVFAGRYELVDPLGEGGAGVVWRAWDRKRQHYVAAKVLRQVDASSLLRFMREQSMRLDHPHVLAPTGWAGEDDKVLFTMPIVPGGSVSTLVSDFGPLPARLTAVLLDQLLAALEAIHAEGIVHRDIKPANLMLDATGRDIPRAWLGDFGIAAGDDAPRLTQGPFAMGTPGYVAPECLHQGWQPDARADLYAAGMCAVEMLTGLSPEADTHVLQALSQADRDDIPEGLIRVVARLGNAVITERYASASHARSALAATGLLESSSPEDILGEVEVFEHVPELPEGWSPKGPMGQTADAQPAPEEVPATGDSLPTQLMADTLDQTTGPSPTQVLPSQPAQQPSAPTQAPTPPSPPESTGGQPYAYAPVPQLGLNDRNTRRGAVLQAPPEHYTPAAFGQQPFPVQPQQPSPQAPPRKGQGLAIAMILFGLGFVVLAAVLFLALD
ncbi:serine/threonine-protein kinase [Nesterenkonia ebinurensis]|uniref:serine/threonine-protein kinase n=1 Tax=Nesterenkonia ebinurensis TaxID=2608252 RepID=UPI00123DDC4B|nr:serine/threonine-protein kinase [Nesterenkonia ebinurensis]